MFVSSITHMHMLFSFSYIFVLFEWKSVLSIKFLKMWSLICIFCVILSITKTISIDLSVPAHHLKYIFSSFEDVAKSCSNDDQCRYKDLVGVKACWGYERNCSVDDSYPVRPTCPGDHRGWVKTKKAQHDTFYTQADFGELCLLTHLRCLANTTTYLHYSLFQAMSKNKLKNWWCCVKHHTQMTHPWNAQNI